MRKEHLNNISDIFRTEPNRIESDSSEYISKLQKEVRFWKQVAYEITKHYEETVDQKNIRIKIF